MFPHPPNAIYPTLTTASLFTLLNASHYPIQMAYFDNTDNANFYFTSSAPEALYAYPVLSQPSTGEGVNEPTTFAYDWSTAEQLGPTVGSATDSQVAANYGEHHVAFSSFGVLCVCLQSQR